MLVSNVIICLVFFFNYFSRGKRNLLFECFTKTFFQVLTSGRYQSIWHWWISVSPEKQSKEVVGSKLQLLKSAGVDHEMGESSMSMPKGSMAAHGLDGYTLWVKCAQAFLVTGITFMWSWSQRHSMGSVLGQPCLLQLSVIWMGM